MVHLITPPKSNLEAENPHDFSRNTKSRSIESIEQIIALMWRLRAITEISLNTAPGACDHGTWRVNHAADELHHDQIVFRPWVRRKWKIRSLRLKWNASWSCRSCGWCNPSWSCGWCNPKVLSRSLFTTKIRTALLEVVVEVGRLGVGCWSAQLRGPGSSASLRANPIWTARHLFSHLGQAFLPPTSQAFLLWLPSWFPQQLNAQRRLRSIKPNELNIYPQPLDPKNPIGTDGGWKIPWNMGYKL